MSDLPSIPPYPGPTNELLDTALALAARGFHVFPLRSASKAPQTGTTLSGRELLPKAERQRRGLDGAGGYHYATDDPVDVRDFWTTWPNANIGVACKPSSLLVIDVDGPEAEEALAKLERELGPLPQTYEVKTGRAEGGRHLYFRRSSDSGDTKKHLVEVREGEVSIKWNGYVLHPPSIHDKTGQAYSMLNASPPVALCAEWESYCCASRRDTGDLVRSRSQSLHQGTTAYGQRAFESELDLVRGEREGNRNDQLNISSMKLAQLESGGELDSSWQDELADAAREAGLEEHEIWPTISSGREKGLTEPRSAPERTSPQRASTGTASPLDSLISNRTNRSSEPDPRAVTGEPAEKPRSAIKSRRVSEIEDLPPNWLDQGIWVRGFVNLFAAPTGSGKSLVLYDYIARLTTGRPMPISDDTHAPADAILITEDAASQMVRPRLAAAGADLDRVHFVDAVERDGDEHLFVVEVDIVALEAMVEQTAAKAIIIDPLVMFSSGRSGEYDDAYKTIPALAKVGERHDAAVIAVVHTPKEALRIESYFMGSTGLRSAARQFNVVLPLPDGNETAGSSDNVRVLVPQKCNLGKPVQGRQFQILEDPQNPHRCYVKWGERELRSAEVLFETHRAEKAAATHGAEAERAIEVVVLGMLEWQGRTAKSRKKTKKAIREDIENALGECSNNMAKTAISRSPAIWVQGSNRAGRFVEGHYELPDWFLREKEAELQPPLTTPVEADGGDMSGARSLIEESLKSQHSLAATPGSAAPVEGKAPSSGQQSSAVASDEIGWLNP